ncbi:MAG: DUF4383 domain-containing protein [Proteobacteria bacterium]|nr:DUF4383 domain-containing protein [Pseudomonadota bacterium]
MKYFSLISGIVLMVIGVAGFFPAMLADMPVSAPKLAITYGSGLLWGIFPVNIMSNLFHTLMGVWGASCYGSSYASRSYARSTAITMAVLAVFGFIPVLNTVLGLMPVQGSNIGFHAILAITAAWFGYASQASELVRRADKFVSGEKPRVAGESKPEQKRAS